MIPVEWIGLARVLRGRIAAAQPVAEAAASELMVPFRDRPREFTPISSPKHLRRLAGRWRTLPAFGRLRVVTSFDAGKLQIVELRVVSARIEAAGWSEDELALAIKLTAITIRPPEFEERYLRIAGVGLHALARRFERGADRTDAAVLRDLLPVAIGWRAAASAKGEFAITVPAGGGWIGAVGPADAVAVVRTFLAH